MTESPSTPPAPARAHDPVTVTWAGIWRGARRLLPVSLFVVPFGLAFGAAAIETGLTALQAVIMSAVVFAGASQFAALELWGEPLPYLSIALVVLAVNARHIILGAALSMWVNAMPWHRRLMVLCVLSDANFADSYVAHKQGERDAGLLLGGGMTLWIAWVISTAVGSAAGASLGSMERLGIDVVMPAFFGALVVSGIKTRRQVVPVAVGCLVAIVSLPFLPQGMNIILAALCGGLSGLLCYDR